jgi:predicted Zn finger-like uncharacterized protein
MILTCPECATRYEIDSAKFPAAGRKVRCKKCSHVWFQPGEGGAAEPEAAPPDVAAPVVAAPAPVPEPAPVFVAPEPVADEDAPPVRAYRGKVTSDEAITPVAKKPTRAKSGGWARTLTHVFGWVALIGAILIIGWATMSYRKQIATTWPKSASLFARMGMAVNTRGLDFTDVEHKSQIEDGQPVLVITGKLVNGATHPVTVPRLRVTLSDDARHTIYNWSFTAAANVAAPGQSVAFRTRLSNPPSAARHVDIHFADNAE